MASSRVALIAILLAFYVASSNADTTGSSRVSSSESTRTAAAPPTSESSSTSTLLTSSVSTKVVSAPTTAIGTSDMIEPPTSETTKAVTSSPRSESTENLISQSSSESISNVNSFPSTNSTENSTSQSSTGSTRNVTTSPSSESTKHTTSESSSASHSTATTYPSSESPPTTETTKAVTSSPRSESTENLTSQSSSQSTRTVTTSPSSESTKHTTSHPSSESPSTGTTAEPKPKNQTWKICVIALAVFVFVVVVIIFLLWCRLRRHKSVASRKQGDEKGNAAEQYPLLPSETYENISEPAFKRGLPNLGNTCYFNAAIQCLISTPILKSQVGDTADQKELTAQFIKFLNPVNPETGSASNKLDPRPLLNVFCAKVDRFRGSRQHDSHEFLRNFLDQLRNEEKEVNQNERLTVVDKIFGGHSMTIYICKDCKTPYHVLEPFLDISVPICRGDDLSQSGNSEDYQTEKLKVEYVTPYQEAAESFTRRLSPISIDLPTEILSITDCLKYFSRQEILGPQYMCNHCANDASSAGPDAQEEPKLSPATKQTLIFNPPAVLVIHLKRFEMKSSGFVKRTNKIKFDELLDLASYCSSWCRRNVDREQNIWYSLYGVVVHSGSLSSGHYVAYVKQREEKIELKKFLQEDYLDRDMTADQLVEMMKKINLTEKATTRPSSTDGRSNDSEEIWYCLNDSKESEVQVDEVLEQEAYLLFYERISPKE